MRVAGTVIVITAVLLTAGCTDREVRASEHSRPAVVDSAVPIDVALDRFRRELPKPQGLTGGFGTREELVRRLAQALEASDTAALRRMVMGKAEFAWLYYPSSPLSQPPYSLPPDLLWFQMVGQTERGAALLLAERAGSPLGYLSHDCKSRREEGANRLHGHCVLRRVTATGDTVGERLFGLVLERGGLYKFVSYANKLD
jgi:hypothetical protein